ncbi:MAG: hypothetical protein WKF43_10710 [Acidimicrobiales bacterium]
MAASAFLTDAARPRSASSDGTSLPLAVTTMRSPASVMATTARTR